MAIKTWHSHSQQPPSLASCKHTPSSLFPITPHNCLCFAYTTCRPLPLLVPFLVLQNPSCPLSPLPPLRSSFMPAESQPITKYTSFPTSLLDGHASQFALKHVPDLLMCTQLILSEKGIPPRLSNLSSTVKKKKKRKRPKRTTIMHPDQLFTSLHQPPPPFRNHRYLLPSHHALSFSLRCGIVSLISVSRSLANSTLRALLLLLGLSFSTFALPRLDGAGLSSAAKVCLGEKVSLRFCLRIDVGLSNPPPTRLALMSADRARGGRRAFFDDPVAGGRLMYS
jgi:hypothetical protein